MTEGCRDRAIRVGIFGNSYWAARLKCVFRNRLVEARQLLVGQDESLMGRSVGKWLSQSELWSCDVLHVLGWPRLWSLWVAARLMRRPVILHWIGSDVLSFLANPRWCRVAGPGLNALVACHLAGAVNLMTELRDVSIYARYEPLGMLLMNGTEVAPLPRMPSVLTYLPPERFNFYGGDKVLEMAKAAPDIHWLVVGNDGERLPRLANVEYLGFVDDMDAVYRKTTVLVRLTEHDGTGVMPIEALERGRHVVWSHRMPFCRLAKTSESALREVRAAIASGSLNLKGAAYVHKEFDVRKHEKRLWKIYVALTGFQKDIKDNGRT